MRRVGAVVVGLMIGACSGHDTNGSADAGHPDSGPYVPPFRPPSLPDRPTAQLPSRVIQEENALPGDSRWDRFVAKSNAGQIEGYADHVSAETGDTVGVQVSADGPHSATWQLIRMGWYGGALGRVVAAGGPFTVSPQATCPMDNYTGLIRCSWTQTFQVPIRSDFVSGMYVIKLVRDDAYGSFVPLIIRDGRRARFLFQSSVLTSQAYNPWHGESLYDDASHTLPWRHAVEVSFDRPYAEGNGAGQQLRYEVYLVRFLERYGYDVTYTTNLDVVAGGIQLLRRSSAFLSVGHDEYWPSAERSLLEQARDMGVSLLFFGANMAYWQVRLADDSGAGPRRIIGWKEAVASDPVQGPESTGRFRDAPINRPENALLGVMYGTWMNTRSPFIVSDENHWLFDGTRMNTGDAIPWLIGYESDTRFDNGSEPANLQVAAQSPTIAIDGFFSRASTVSYRAPSGALVFSTGSIEWIWGLSYPGIADARVARMTANILQEAAGVPVPDNLPAPVPPHATIDTPLDLHVRTILRNRGTIAGIATLPGGALAVTEADRNRVLLIGPPPNRDVTVLAGTGDAGAGDWTSAVPGAEAEFRNPTGIVADALGNLFVADTGNDCIRMIRNDAVHTVTTPDGYCGASGYSEGSGWQALFSAPMGMTLDPVTGDLIVADSWNHRVRRIQLTTFQTSTVVGTSEGARDGLIAQAQLDFPTGVAFDPLGNLYVLSSADFRVVRVSPGPLGVATTLAGGRVGISDGSGSTAGIAPAVGAVWMNGGLVFSDASAGRIRVVTPGNAADDSTIATLAGAGDGNCRDGDSRSATFLMPLGLAVDPNGVLYVADSGNGAIRAVGP